MSKGLVARASTEVQAPPGAVWDALVDPQQIKRYMPGTDVVSDWMRGSPIVWKGEYEGQRFEDKGTILDLEPGRRLRYSHFSPLSGEPDVPEHYHTVTVELTPGGREGTTAVTLTQDNNDDASARDHAAAFWQQMLDRLKDVVEQ